ncbi:hypothetical protein HYT56_03750 [Candidatus Woesearchaeota archaeon]|nr:hypothetical protein [Candidatus Woesearchaeota archaeon]
MEKLRNDLLNNREKLIFGSDRNLKLLKNDMLQRIYLSKNCRRDVKDTIKTFEKRIELVELEETNDEIGVVCKKPFSISVIGLSK